MIRESKTITLAEARELLKKAENDKAKAISDFIKKFTKLSASEALKLRKALEGLNILRLKEEDIVKIVDFEPEDVEDIRKIFAGSEFSLDQDEITKVLEVLKQKK
ncbi:MAG: DNA-directed RNA polymerase subunit F [Candidatus Pacearchaeota archaeon]|nr:MAG: DNA-directed RNA polymerase subunit F [Candidatus Pacearchaeota archaeon]